MNTRCFLFAYLYSDQEISPFLDTVTHLNINLFKSMLKSLLWLAKWTIAGVTPRGWFRLLNLDLIRCLNQPGTWRFSMVSSTTSGPFVILYISLIPHEDRPLPSPILVLHRDWRGTREKLLNCKDHISLSGERPYIELFSYELFP